MLGTAFAACPDDLAPARTVAAAAGLREGVPAFAVARLQASGGQALAVAVALVASGAAEVAIAAAADSASRMPYHVPGSRFGPETGEATVVDPLHGLSAPAAVVAEERAAATGITRAEQDAFAARSHALAAASAQERLVAVHTPNGALEHDELVRPDVTTDVLGALKPLHTVGGTVTVGNAAHPGDGGAAVVVTAEPGTTRLAAAGTTAGGGESAVVVQETSVVVQETSAAHVLLVARELGVDPESLNPSGGAIARGAPLAAAGLAAVVDALELVERGIAPSAFVVTGDVLDTVAFVLGCVSPKAFPTFSGASS